MADIGAARTIILRYPDTCSSCGAALPARTEARWNEASRTIRCLRCWDATASAEHGEPNTEGPTVADRAAFEPPVARPPPPRPLAGASAQAEYDRRHLKREQRLEVKWGRLAGMAKFLSDDPQSTKAWARGAEGERRLAAQLARALGDRAVFLHDRKHGRANIDHLVIASSGVWVVDAKSYEGRVEYRNVGGWFGPADNRIYVGGRDKTKLAGGLDWQVKAVRAALGNADAPIHPVLCFTSSDWGFLAKPFRHKGVLVTWASKLAEMIAEPGPLGPETIAEVAQRLNTELRPAT